MKRVREVSSSSNWNKRVITSWEGSTFPLDLWKILVAHLNDFRSVLALGRVNLALYTAFGGFEKLLDVALARGYYEIIDYARRGTVNGETLLHPLKWTTLTHGEYDDSRSLFQQLAEEMDRAEPNVRMGLANANVNSIPSPVMAGGFVRVLVLRLFRRTGVATSENIVDHYTDIDIWLDGDTWNLSPFSPLLRSLANSEDISPKLGVNSINVNTWSMNPIQCIVSSLFENNSNRNYADCVLWYFDFTCCQVGITFRDWDEGEITLTPAFLYSLMTGCMFEVRTRVALPYPFKTLEPESVDIPPLYQVKNRDKARLIQRFFKYVRLGYRDPTLSTYDVARMAYIFKGAPVQKALQEMEEDATNYIFIERLMDI